ncbi:MarR family winged helix-turn-helix transcriptional regulator [Streptomyces sp. NPDC050560]|uniref:MarR family winged helix-turn-helix transcriptional regulator n=1 Tax=Streptomyces sp. NPDC050560 TaxID=3365630 RepID=UPI00379EE73B
MAAGRGDVPRRRAPARGDGDELAVEAARLRHAVMRLGRRLRAERSAEALSANKLSVLGHLWRGGPMSAGALAAADHQQPQSLTRVFAELERDGLVSRVRSREDRRQWVLDLTTDGRAALTRDMAERDAWLARALAGLTTAERQVVGAVAGLLEDLADTDTDTDTAAGAGRDAGRPPEGGRPTAS